MIGDIMGISRLRMGTDGAGVTTLVTFFGCPLHCKYCINNFCHETDRSYGVIPRGVYMPEELFAVLEKDDIYYRMSGGGVTFGGGEPLLQSAFIHEVCKWMPSAWKKRIETSLNVPWRYVEPLKKDLDEWIIDIKDMDPYVYEKYTGTTNTNLRNNIFRLMDVVKPEKLHVRVPRIPGYNDEDKIKESVKWVKDVMKVKPEVFDYIVPVEINKRVNYEGGRTSEKDSPESFCEIYCKMSIN